MQADKTKRFLFTTISAFLLCVGFLIIRYAIFTLHYLSDWSLFLFIFGAVVISVATVFNGKKTMIFAASGYIVGFFAGVLFQTDWVDSKGTAMNSLWIWWTCTMLIFVFIGAAWEIAGRKMKRNK